MFNKVYLGRTKVEKLSMLNLIKNEKSFIHAALRRRKL